MKMKNAAGPLIVLTVVSVLFMFHPGVRAQAPDRAGYVTDPGKVLPNDVRANMEKACKSDGRIYVYVHKGPLQNLMAASDMLWNKWGLKNDNVLLVVSIDGKNVHFRIRRGAEVSSTITERELSEITGKMENLFSAGQVQQALLSGIESIHSELSAARDWTIGITAILLVLGGMIVLMVIFAKRRSLKEKREQREALEDRLSEFLRRMETLTVQAEKQRRVAQGFPPEIKKKFHRQFACLSSGSIKEVLDGIEALNGSLYRIDVAVGDRKAAEIESAIDEIAEAVELVERLAMGEDVELPAAGETSRARSVGTIHQRDYDERREDTGVSAAGIYVATDYVEHRSEGRFHSDLHSDEARTGSSSERRGDAQAGDRRYPSEGAAVLGGGHDPAEGAARIGSSDDPSEGHTSMDEPLIADPFGGSSEGPAMEDFSQSSDSGTTSDFSESSDSSESSSSSDSSDFSTTSY